MALFNQGTQLYFLDPDGNSGNGEVVKLDCAKAITGVSSPRADQDITCLEDTDGLNFAPIFGSPGTASITLDFDPRIASHLRVGQLYQSRTTVHWVIGFSDGKNIAPTVGSDGFDLPPGRTWREFEGYVNDLPLDWGTNAYLALQLPVRITSDPGPVIPRVSSSA